MEEDRDMIKHRSKFFMRIVTPYFILLLVVLLAAEIFVYSLVTERIKTDAIANGRQLAEKTAQQADGYLGDMDVIAQQICRQTEIVNYFYMLQNEADSANKFDTDMLKNIELSSALKRILVGRTADYNVTIYNDYGDFISSREYATNKADLRKLIEENDYETLITRLEANNGILILPPEKNKWTNDHSEYITVTRILKNDYSDKPCGIIEVRCDVSVFPGAIGAGADRVIVINNADEKVVFPTGYEGEFTDRQEYISAPLNMVDWSIELRVPEAGAGGVSIWIVITFAIGYIILGVFMFVFANYLGRYITRPIAELTRFVKSVDTPDMELKPVNDDAIDEIQELEDSFAKMLSRMNRSILQEKKAYSLALQAQMNPHFLYNSLAVIGAAGSEAGADEVYDMCIELSDMLRYVAAYEKVTVPLKEELLHTQNYLSLMKCRYEDYFTYTIEADEELMNMAVPKLIIQPLAENCFMHGFKGKEPPWNIDIQLRGNPKKWELTIKDNGTGIDEESLGKIKQKLNSSDSEMTVGNIGGLGVVNTITRLKMTHSKRISYEIYNDDGMVIKIKAEDE